MPELIWKGKDKVVNHHHDVPFRVLRRKYEYAAPEGTPANTTGNMIIHGDNLEALKALLPEYEGRVKCIYIDPPYNTGNEGWIYNDNVNDPRICKWLGQVVGKEGEDLTRHDKWLCMMYPRLKLLHRFLSDDGVIFISLDENEQANLKAIADEIFGIGNRVGVIVWKNATDNNPTNISTEHEYIVCYSKNKGKIDSIWKAANLDVKDKLLEIGEQLVAKHESLVDLQKAYTKWYRENRPYIWPFQDYKFIDREGIYTGSRSVHNPGTEGYRYDVFHPLTKKPCKQPLMGYRFPESSMRQLLDEQRIIFGEDETKLIELKIYAKDFRAKLASVIELDGRMGANELKAIFPESKKVFDHPKPSLLIEELISFVTKEDDILLDSFAGSSTTAHAVLKLNQADGGNRKFIMVEMMDYAESITAERVRRVMAGYGTGDKATAGLGGGFAFYEIGEPLLTSEGLFNPAVDLEELRRYVAYSENIPAAQVLGMDNPHTPDLLGLVNDTAYFFCCDPAGPTTLDLDWLAALNFRPAALVVYADQCLLEPEFMQSRNIIFKKIPRDVARY